MHDAGPETATASAGECAIVVPGCLVRMRDAEGEHQHLVVSKVTADTPPECISVASPVGRALLGRKRGEQVQVHTPDGIRLLTVVDVAAPLPSSPAGDRACTE